MFPGKKVQISCGLIPNSCLYLPTLLYVSTPNSSTMHISFKNSDKEVSGLSDGHWVQSASSIVHGEVCTKIFNEQLPDSHEHFSSATKWGLFIIKEWIMNRRNKYSFYKQKTYAWNLPNSLSTTGDCATHMLHIRATNKTRRVWITCKLTILLRTQ